MDIRRLAPKVVLDSFAAVFDRLKEQGRLTPALTLGELEGALNPRQREVVERILTLDPKDYGVTIPYLGVEAVPNDLVRVTGQRVWRNGEAHIISEKLMPRPIYMAFERMNRAFEAAHSGRKLLVSSGYRSPASQIVTFISWCNSAYEGDIARTVRHASPPAYSQHTSASKTAIDVVNVDGQPAADDLDGFRDTAEYAWLQVHAAEYGFFESWKEGNEFGMRPEPWHWQYLGI